jgi:hypothetical protein
MLHPTGRSLIKQFQRELRNTRAIPQAGDAVSLAEYISRDYLSVKSPYRIDAQNMADLDAQRYTSVADLESVLKFSQLPEAAPDHFSVRNTRELHMEDLKDSNAVLLGSAFSNPWVELFRKI